MTAVLRIAAVALAVVALLDPAFTVRRAQPLPIDVRLPPAGSPDLEAASATRARMLAALGDRVAPAQGTAPAAVVLIGDPPAGGLPLDVPISAVALTPAAPNVRLVNLSTPATVMPGQLAPVHAHLQGIGVRGRTTTVTLEQNGAVLAQADHAWREDREDARISLPFVAPEPGVYQIRVSARPFDGEPTRDNIADAALTASGRRLRVLSYEPRPSWAGAFVRRAIEAHPAFEVASIVRFSKGIAARAGDPPTALDASALEPYDAVIVAAPEGLRRDEVAALDRFVRLRGGVAVLLPDAPPSGAYLSLLPAAGFDEALLEAPVRIEGAPARPSASEFALLRDPGAGAAILGTMPRGERQSVAIAAWPRGAGRVVFSGALDAWRFRARDEGAFARFWTSTIAGFAAAAPPRVSVSVQPSRAVPGGRVIVRVAVRPTEYMADGGRVLVPPVSGSLIDEGGRERPVRLWPAAELGVFEGTIEAPATGRYIVRASLLARRDAESFRGSDTFRGSDSFRDSDSFRLKAEATSSLSVSEGVHQVVGEQEQWMRLVAAMSGGVMTTAGDLAPLERHLAAIPRPQMDRRVHPARSLWWFWAFAAVTCAEWTLRRTRGMR